MMPSSNVGSTVVWRMSAPVLMALFLALVMSVPGFAQSQDADQLGTAAVQEFIDMLSQDDVDKRADLEDFLADEFQIVRSNGAHLDKAGYLEDPSTVLQADIEELHGTLADDTLVVSYVLSVDIVLDGEETRTLAPRLSVFRRGDDKQWRIVSHANFGALDANG